MTLFDPAFAPFIYLGLFVLVFLPALATIFHAIRHEKSGAAKALWVLIALLFPLLGPLLYVSYRLLSRRQNSLSF